MKPFSILFTFFLSTVALSAQTIYSKAYGDKKSTPIIFLHGGPGYNCANFEATTAQKLADQGFYVIVYDRRGEGRSIDTKASFTFKETLADLNDLYKKYKLKTASLIGHSFGGLVATLFAEKYSKKTNALVLVGSPVVFQETFKTIISNCRKNYTEKNDEVSLGYMDMLEKVDSTTLEYMSYCFYNAFQNGLYSTKHMTKEAIQINLDFSKDSLYKYSMEMTRPPTEGFFKNEKYSTMNLTTNLQNLVKNKIPIYAMYGKEDGLFSVKQVSDFQNIIGESNLKYFDNCSHAVYIHQQSLFIEALKGWLK